MPWCSIAARAAFIERIYADGNDGSPGLPGDWDDIEPGQLVIANEGPGYGWWDAIVVEVNGDMLTLHWRDFSLAGKCRAAPVSGRVD